MRRATALALMVAAFSLSMAALAHVLSVQYLQARQRA